MELSAPVRQTQDRRERTNAGDLLAKPLRKAQRTGGAVTVVVRVHHKGERDMTKKRALVCGAGGFIGSHLVRRLKSEGYWVRGVDIKNPEFSRSEADSFVLGDLRDLATWESVLDCDFDEAYQLAADMGG